MSSLLKEAIVDAKALREAALKNAEDAVINKYSNEVRKTLNTLLEQEDILGDMDLDLDSDAEPDMSMGSEKPSMAIDDSFIDDIDEVPYAAENGLSSLKGSRNLDNSHLDSLTDAIFEKLTVDMGADLSGWAGDLQIVKDGNGKRISTPQIYRYGGRIRRFKEGTGRACF
jgi:hypothetical protein